MSAVSQRLSSRVEKMLHNVEASLDKVRLTTRDKDGKVA